MNKSVDHSQSPGWADTGVSMVTMAHCCETSSLVHFSEEKVPWSECLQEENQLQTLGCQLLFPPLRKEAEELLEWTRLCLQNWLHNHASSV